MPEKEITKKVTKVIKDLDKLAQLVEQAIKDVKKLGEREKDEPDK